ncbi:UNVERIFIED_CONTAM: Thiol-disulfide oxidoreductase LTO1 [Sesamum latifolium]|uniref:Thiol-disulfide oxidoreductase LTO1 n=1 Tax=Sesamum latifolium TaxID=2727402 RepID=A0AAW2X6H8_9LAMI
MMMATTSSFFTLSLSSIPSYRTPFLHSHPRFPVPSHSKKGVWGQRFVVHKVNCVSERSKSSAQSESETTSLSPSCLESSSSSTFIEEDEGSILAYKWCAALGGIGFAETGYLTFLKLTDTDALCPMGGGSCTTILNSDYSSVLGINLIFVGIICSSDL